MTEMIDIMREAFSAYSSGDADAPQRISLSIPENNGVVLFKPARVWSRALGAKLVSVFPGNRDAGKPTTTGLVILLDAETGEPSAICDGTFLTAWRTGATCGLATHLLARADAEAAAVIGAGSQARTQILAMDAVRELKTIHIWAPTSKHVDEIIDELQPKTRARLRASGGAPTAVANADIICTATTSLKPVIKSEWIKPGAHVNAVGSFRPEMQEVSPDLATVAKIFVDTRSGCALEAGELIVAIEEGRTTPDKWTEIGEVVNGTADGRREDGDITLFKSVGVAIQDVAAAAAALAHANEMGLGSTIEF